VRWRSTLQNTHFEVKVNDINDLYKQAPELAKQGQRVESTNEMTGVQAMERKHPDNGKTVQMDLSRQGAYCLTPYLFMPTCTKMSVYPLGGFQVYYGETALSERFIPRLQSRIAHLLVYGHGRLLAIFLTLYGLAVLRYISGAIVSFFISRQATGNQRAGNAAWPVAE
jgi:hypothetical protein